MELDGLLLEELRDVATQFSCEAGEIALSFFGKELTRELKHDGTIVTAADREIEQRLRQRISERYPDDGIVGEEFGVTDGRTGRRWILDPIDGTFSFAHGVPLFGTLIGVEIDGRAAVGAVRMPALGETVCAAAGMGTLWNGTAAHCSTVDTLADALVLCGDFYAGHLYERGPLSDAVQRAAGHRRGWGDCYAYVLVATGRAEVALDHVMSIWDCAALAPILEEAGGTFTDWQGRATIDGGNAIATNGPLFREVMQTVRAQP